MEWMTQEFVKSIFDYDPVSGWLFWKYNPNKFDNWNSRFAGKPAGTFSGEYIYVSIGDEKYPAHRVIFLWLHGYLPERVDHVNDDGYNNRPDNLRSATHAQNIFKGFYVKSRGVEKHGKKYRARIGSRENRINIGSFDTYEEARAAYEKAAVEIYGEFAR